MILLDGTTFSNSLRMFYGFSIQGTVMLKIKKEKSKTTYDNIKCAAGSTDL